MVSGVLDARNYLHFVALKPRNGTFVLVCRSI